MESLRDRNDIKIRLRTKFMVGIVVLECVLMAATILLVENRMRTTALDEFIKRGYSIARNLAAMNANYVTTYNYVKIKQSVEKVAGQAGLVYVAVQLFNGDVAGYTGPQPMREMIFDDAMLQWVLGDDTEKVRERMLPQDRIYDITTPITVSGERWGNACIGISIAPMNAAILQTQIALAAMGSIGLIFGCIGSLFLARRITRPINALVESVDAIANKDYDNPIHIGSRDEIGYLGVRFVAMRQMIKEQVVDLRSSNEKLEKEIAERKRAEEELEQYRYFLEDLVEERTNKLKMINKRLHKEVHERKRAEKESVLARNQAEEASHAKSQFLASMSHEIRTPMNGVLGMAELLSRMDLNKMQKKQVDMIRLSGETLLNIINDILDLSKIEAGRLELEPHPFDLSRTVEDVTRLFAGRSHEKNLELASVIRSDVFPLLVGDSVRLRQIITNLVGNAMKFTEDGEIRINVCAAEEVDGRPMIRFEVKDTGIGMTPEAQERIFESFSQADSSIARKFGGTGLGLSISKQLAEKMGGTIGVRSKPGEGATFWFTACFEKQEDAAIGSFDLSGRRVLVVENNPTRSGILLYYIGEWGGRGELAEGAGAAIEVLQHALGAGTLYDAAILGQGLPDMDALSLAGAIRSMPGLTGIRLVVLTEDGAEKNYDRIRLAGADVNLDVPICQSDLHSSLTADKGELERGHLAETAEGDETFSARMLLAEDNSVNQEVGRSMLESFGITVEIAEDGKAALEASGKNRYDMIFMDCQMPVMDGYEATQAIRGRETEEGGEEGRVPIIALTAHAMGNIRERCLDSGMDDYLAKPFNRKQLGIILTRWLAPENALLPAKGEAPKAEPEPALSEEGVIDVRVLNEIREIESLGSPDLLNRVVDTYLNSASASMGSLREAVAEDDADAISRVAHSFKSSCGNVGAKSMAALCLEMEEMGIADVTDRAKEVFSRIEVEFARVQQALAAEL